MSELTQLAPDYIQAIAPYRAGKPVSELARELGLNPETVVKLASNENPLGVSEKAKDAIDHAVAELGRYPDSNGFSLKRTISERFNVQSNQITLGNGSNDVLELVAKAFLCHGRNAVFSEYAFAVYPLATQGCGAAAKVVPAIDYGHDLDGFLNTIDQDTRIVFVANPNNPTGTFLKEADLKRFLDQVPSEVVVVLDEAYNEYLAPDQQYDSTRWLEQYPNLIISRSFSKAYGLAGLRVGYGLSSPEVADLMNRVRQPFNVNSIALAAAEASLGDSEFLQRTYQVNRSGLAQLQSGFDELGLQYVPSSANFVLVKVGESATAGQQLFELLLREGVIVRPVGAYGLGQWIRVSIGLELENKRFLEVLPQCLKGVS
ncbi:MAG: histidinol-phosphate transaminase [Limnobacter sp.]|nr:histidinol-phosphate transaminase [Limnobacter sp.]